MFYTVSILDILQKGLLVFGCEGCLIHRIDMHSIVPLSEQSQLPEMVKDMCSNEKHACQFSHLCVILRHLLSSELHCKKLVFIPLSLLLGQSLHHAIHMIQHVIVHCDNMMQCDCMPLRHPQSPISEWPQHIHDILHNGPFILCCEE